jgi:hypothetical protein
MTSGRYSLVVLGLIAASSCSSGDIGSLSWTERGGGALQGAEPIQYVLGAVPELSKGYLHWLVHSPAAKVDLESLGPPDSAIVKAAWARLALGSDPAFVNHSIRTAYWTVAVMWQEKPGLTRQELDEAWVAALLHDVGLAESPASGEFTLGGVAAVRELAAKQGWDKSSADRASEAITLNPNSRIDREKYGLLAWAMNIGGFGETFHGPYRILMNPENIRELEEKYPRLDLPARSEEILGRELKRFPNQRFGVLRRIGFLKLMR